MYIKPEDIEKFIYDNSLATEDEVRLVCQINGWSTDTLNKIINCRTEYQDIEQIHACEPDTYVFDSVESYFEEEDEDDEPEDDDDWDAYVASNAYGSDN
jgi:hypothetical protein